jgi:hypothetical protein
MAATALTERHAPKLHGVLSCYDRIIVTGTLPGTCYAGRMTSFLYSRGIRIFDCPRFAEPLRERIRERAQQVCEAAGVQIEHVNKSHVRKEDLLARVLPQRAGSLARSLRRENIEFVQEDNAFLRVANLPRAQALADGFNPEQLHRRLTRYAHWLCPVADVFAQDDWHWSIRQAEYATDLMFRSEQVLVPLYDAISRRAVLAADAPRVAGFLGKRITPQLAQEIGSRVLRVETTVNDVSFFKHHRKVEHRGAAATRELAPLKKSIYGLIDLREILLGCSQRYLAFVSGLDDPSAGERDLQGLSQPHVGTDPSVKGLNFFSPADQALLRTLQHGEFNIHGWCRADLVARLAMTPTAMTRRLRRLRGLGLIKKRSRGPGATT